MSQNSLLTACTLTHLLPSAVFCVELLLVALTVLWGSMFVFSDFPLHTEAFSKPYTSRSV